MPTHYRRCLCQSFGTESLANSGTRTRDRTLDLLLVRQSLIPAELYEHITIFSFSIYIIYKICEKVNFLVPDVGLEPYKKLLLRQPCLPFATNPAWLTTKVSNLELPESESGALPIELVVNIMVPRQRLER